MLVVVSCNGSKTAGSGGVVVAMSVLKMFTVQKLQLTMLVRVLMLTIELVVVVVMSVVIMFW